ncbi:MAG: hypothetical protein FJ143_02520 [Deltaproteobacteria bacterium]|nr:hypothetical protein [Deltaproteobacteria bacterium]
MKLALWIIFGAYLYLVVCWLFFLAIMHLTENRSKAHGIVLFHGYLIHWTGWVLDVLLNAVLFSVLFVDFPRELTATARLNRYLRADLERKGWRAKLACWFCSRWLDPFDPKGRHCRDK